MWEDISTMCSCPNKILLNMYLELCNIAHRSRPACPRRLNV